MSVASAEPLTPAQTTRVDTHAACHLQKIEAPVRGNEASDGGPPMSERLGGNDQLFIQEDGAKEKNLLGTGASTCACCISEPCPASGVLQHACVHHPSFAERLTMVSCCPAQRLHSATPCASKVLLSCCSALSLHHVRKCFTSALHHRLCFVKGVQALDARCSLASDLSYLLATRCRPRDHQFQVWLLL